MSWINNDFFKKTATRVYLHKIDLSNRSSRKVVMFRPVTSHESKKIERLQSYFLIMLLLVKLQGVNIVTNLTKVRPRVQCKYLQHDYVGILWSMGVSILAGQLGLYGWLPELAVIWIVKLLTLTYYDKWDTKSGSSFINQCIFSVFLCEWDEYCEI